MVSIFSGFAIPSEHYAKLLAMFPEVEAISRNGMVYVGERLTPVYSVGDVLEIDLIREWSVTDKVRKTRFELWKVDPVYINVYPKLFIL